MNVSAPLSRRSFLEAAGLISSAAMLLPRTVWAADKDFSLRYLVGSSLYGNLSLTEILPEVAKSGSHSIDLWPRKHGTQREEADQLGPQKLAELLQQHGVKVDVTTRFDLGPFKLADEIRFLQAQGGKLIVTGTGGTGGKAAATLTGPALKEEVRKFVELLRPTLTQAGEAGVMISIENHADTLIFSPDSLRWLADYAQGLPLGIALAPYHLEQDTKMLADLIRALDQKLLLFYAWEYGHSCMKPLPKVEELMQLPGHGTLDFTPLLRALKDIRFAGWTEIFMHPTPRGIPIMETATLVTAEVNRSRQYLEQCLKSLAG